MGVLTHTKQACTDFKWEMNRKNRYSPLNVNFRGKKESSFALFPIETGSILLPKHLRLLQACNPGDFKN